VLDGPAAVVALLRAHGRRQHERKPERREERQLARLRPQDVGLGEEGVAGAKVAVEIGGRDDAHAGVTREIAAGDERLEAARHGGPRAREQRDAQASRLDERTQRRQEPRREPRLRARATHGEHEQRRLLVDGGPDAEPSLRLGAERLAEASAAIEAREPTREVPARDDELGSAQQLVGQRKPREQDARLGHAVGREPPGGALRGREVTNAALRGHARHPRAREIRVGHEAVDVGLREAIGGEGRREERREERRLLALERGDEAATEAAREQPLEQPRRERGRR